MINEYEAAMANRKKCHTAVFNILEALEPLDVGTEEAEALIQALILIGATHAAHAALGAMDEDGLSK